MHPAIEQIWPYFSYIPGARVWTDGDRAGRQAGQDNASSSALASCRSAVSKPSVNQP
jgi:hypothetical protein